MLGSEPVTTGAGAGVRGDAGAVLRRAASIHGAWLDPETDTQFLLALSHGHPDLVSEVAKGIDRARQGPADPLRCVGLRRPGDPADDDDADGRAECHPEDPPHALSPCVRGAGSHRSESACRTA